MTQHALTTILLIEDSPSDVRLIEELLYKSSHQSFNVITASTLAGGLELLSANSVDAILLDLGLPDSQGIDTVRVVHKRASHLPIIVLTVSDDEELGERALQEGAQRFITKDAFTLGVPYAGIFTRMIRFAVAQARAEAAFSKSERQYRQLVDTASIIILTADPELIITYCNEYTLKLLGYTADEFFGQPVVGTLLPPTESTGRDLAQMARDILDHPEDYIHNRNEVMTKDGRRLWIEWTNAPQYDKDGTYLGILSTGIDITEREHFKHASILNEIIHVINESLTLPILYERVLATILEQMKFERGLVATVSDTGALTVEYAYNHSPAFIKAVNGLKVNDNSFMRSMYTQREIVVSDTPMPGTVSFRLGLKGAVVGIPFFSEGKVVGHVSFHAAEERAFTADEQALFRTIGLELGSAVIKLQAIARAEEYARQQQIISEVIKAGNEADTLRASLSSILSTAVELMEFDSGLIFLLNKAGNVAELQYAQGCSPDFIEARQHVPLSHKTIARVYQGEPLFMEEYQTEVTSGYDPENMVVAAGIPLLARGRVIGHYAVLSARQHGFSEGERALLVTLGREAGTVVARLQAEETLKRAEARYRDLVEKSFDAVLIHSDGIIRLANEAAARILKAKSPQALVGMHILDLPAPRYREQAEERISAVYETRQSTQPAEFQYCALDGTTVDVEAMATLITYEGRPALYVVFRDIGERKQIEAQLQQYAEHLEDLIEERTAQLSASEKQYRTLVETANSPILTLDTAGTITFVNDYGARFFGYTSDELTGQNVMIIVPETESSGRQLPPIIDDIIARPDEHTISLNENITKDGRRVWVNWVNKSLIDEEGHHIGHLAIGTDMTEQIRAEAALKEAERLAAIGQTAAMIGHDLRNPLQGLQYIVDLRKLRFDKIPLDKRSTEDWEKEQALFDRISAQVFYMDKIVGDLQDYARPIAPEHEEITIRAVIDDVLEAIPFADGVETIINVSDLKFVVDPHLMIRVFSNLILNAIQAMPNGGKLTIAAEATDGSVAIYISDTGVGIAPDMREKVFSPLTTGKAKGTGLGLAVVKRIIEAHNGTITFASEEGKGTTFTVTLPLKAV